MKLTISVPDPLWVSVYTDGDSPSSIIQEGLGLLAERRASENRAFAKAPGGDFGPTLESVYSKKFDEVVESAATSLSSAYSIGVEIATTCKFSELDRAARRLDLIPALRQTIIDPSFGDLPPVFDHLLWKLICEYGEAAAIGGDGEEGPEDVDDISETFLAAIADGVQDTHRAVLQTLEERRAVVPSAETEQAEEAS